MFTTAAECTDSELVQCNWKLDSSTTMASYATGSITAPTTGSPTLPTAATRSPAAPSMLATMRTTVVLPLVPVTASQGAGFSTGLSRQASSTSPHTGTPPRAAATKNGWPGRTPGEGTTSVVPSGGCSVAPSPARTETPTPSR